MSETREKPGGFEFDELQLFPRERLLTRNTKRIPLTPRVLDVLIVLVENAGNVVTKDVLLNKVWAGSFVEEGNINRTISTLRKSLGLQANGSDFIETVPKLGYRFIASVREFSEARIEAAALPERKDNSRNLLFAGGIALFLVAAIAFLFFLSRSGTPVSADSSVNLTNNVAEDNLPALSPDGSKIAFTSNRDGPGDIYVMNSDGNGVKRLTFTPVAESSSTWSADGSKIVFESARDGNGEIYIMDADGSNQKRLTFNASRDAGPAYLSPDGTRIVFSRNAAIDGFNYDIYTMNADGDDVRQITRDTEFDAEPKWSADGSKIFFISARTGNLDTFAINADGSGESNLTRSPESDGPIGVSQDGRQVFIIGDSPAKPDINQIWVIDADGGNRRQISSFTEKVFWIDFSPNHKRLVFAGKKTGNLEIYVTDAMAEPDK